MSDESETLEPRGVPFRAYVPVLCNTRDPHGALHRIGMVVGVAGEVYAESDADIDRVAQTMALVVADSPDVIPSGTRDIEAGTAVEGGHVVAIELADVYFGCFREDGWVLESFELDESSSVCRLS